MCGFMGGCVLDYFLARRSDVQESPLVARQPHCDNKTPGSHYACHMIGCKTTTCYVYNVGLVQIKHMRYNCELVHI